MPQHKYLLIVLPTAVHRQISLQKMARLLEQVILLLQKGMVVEVVQHFLGLGYL